MADAGAQVPAESITLHVRTLTTGAHDVTVAPGVRGVCRSVDGKAAADDDVAFRRRLADARHTSPAALCIIPAG